MKSPDLPRKEFAALLGLTTRQIVNLEHEGLPHHAEGNRKFYPMPEAAQWYWEQKLRRAIADAKPNDYDNARAREMAARAEKAELEVLQMRGELIHLDDLDLLDGDYFARIRSWFLSLPGRVAAVLPMDAVEAVGLIEPLVFELMQELGEDDEPEELEAVA